MHRLGLFLVFFLIVVAPARAQAPVARLPKNALRGLDQLIEKLRQEWEVPGLAVALVTPDRILYAKGFGQRDVAGRRPVTPNTLFGIASCSKSLGAATVCLLASEGHLSLDQPIHDYWPGFRLRDDHATLRCTARDLLSHRSGLPRHDLVWYHNSSVPRAELVRRLRYLPPVDELRTAFHYQNLGYTALSQLIQEVSPGHASWEEVARRRLLIPLGMTRTNFSVHDSERDPDHSLPYRLRDIAPQPQLLPLEDVDALGAAGNVNSTALDMARWLQATLTDGVVGGQEVLPTDALHLTHEPQMTYDLRAPDEDVYTDTYAMGWVIGSYRGYRLMSHSGSLDGFTSEMAVLPAEGVGVVVLSNLDDTDLPHLLTNTLLDRLTGLTPIDWSGRYRYYEEEDARAAAAEDSIPDPFRVTGTHPAHRLTAYAGHYRHPAYGDLRLRASPDGHLRGDLHGLGIALAHYQYETFATDASSLLPDVGPTTGPDADPVPAGALRFAFVTDARGDVSRLTVALEPEAEPIAFDRVPDTIRLARADLLRFVGEYGPSVRESYRVVLPETADTLRITWAGQGPYALVAVRANEFIIPRLPGYTLRFVLPENGSGPATEVLTIQPDGIFRDRRRPAADRPATSSGKK